MISWAIPIAGLSLAGNGFLAANGFGAVRRDEAVYRAVEAHRAALGALIRREPAEAPGLPDSIVAVLHGTGRARILIIAHIDTLFGPGTAAARPFSIDGDRAHGPGVGDEKGGVVNAVIALEILHALGFKKFATITMLLDNSEERGSPGSTHLIETLARRSSVEFNMESGNAATRSHAQRPLSPRR